MTNKYSIYSIFYLHGAHFSAHSYPYGLHIPMLADVISPSKDLTLNIKDFLICGEQLNFLQYMEIVLFLI